MKKIIKKLFHLYDGKDLSNVYFDAYQKGKATGEREAISKKYTPNQLREVFGLNPIQK